MNRASYLGWAQYNRTPIVGFTTDEYPFSKKNTDEYPSTAQLDSSFSPSLPVWKAPYAPWTSLSQSSQLTIRLENRAQSLWRVNLKFFFFRNLAGGDVENGHEFKHLFRSNDCLIESSLCWIRSEFVLMKILASCSRCVPRCQLLLDPPRFNWSIPDFSWSLNNWIIIL
jgi:hypothetical protein